MRNEAMILVLKARARAYIEQKNWISLQSTLQHLDHIWKDDNAAKAFYAELEKERAP